jgi:outer membrane protein TolC
MKYILIALGLSLAVCLNAPAQTPPAGAAPLRLTFPDALERARQYSPETLTANIAASLAREDRLQAKAALLPEVAWLSQSIYTQPNGAPTGVFVSNDGPHVYNNYASAHADVYAPAKLADYRRAGAAEAVAKARAEVAARGLFATVTQDYYALALAGRKLASAQQAVRDAQHFFDITSAQEQGGEAAHADTVKARIELVKTQADEREAQLALTKARMEFAILLFPDYRQDYIVVDDLDTLVPLPALDDVKARAARNNPDMRAAQATVEQQQHELASARAARYPSLSVDYFFGSNANQVAIHDELGQNLWGSVLQAQVNIPVWTWGASASRVRQGQLRLQQARNDLTFTQRQLLSDLDQFYAEVELARLQLPSLRDAMDLSQQSLDLTLDRYQAGESSAQEVVDAQVTLRDARDTYHQGLARYRLAIGNLQTLTGAF